MKHRLNTARWSSIQAREQGLLVMNAAFAHPDKPVRFFRMTPIEGQRGCLAQLLR